MIYLATCFICVIGIELFIALPFLHHIGSLVAVSKKSTRVISSSKISDNWKEKALQRYSRDMAVASLTLGALLAVLAFVVGIIAYFVDMLLGSDISILEYFVTAQGLLIATVFSLVYVALRNRVVSK